MPFLTALRLSLRRVGTPLVIWFILTQIFDQWVMDSTSQALNSESGGMAKIWIFAGLSILSSVVGPVVATVLVLSSWVKTDQPAGFFLGQHLSLLIREQLRVLGQIMLWGLLFIIPGVVRFFELSLVPWVVCFDPEYNQGQKDALKESRHIFYRIWFLMIPLLVVFWVLVPLLMTGLDSYRSYFETPLTALGLSLVDVFAFIVFQWLLSKIWRKAHGPELSTQFSLD